MPGLGILRRVVGEVRSDVAAARDRDPAARGASTVEILTSWAGVQALLAHRVANVLHEAGVPLAPLAISYLSRSVTGVEIHPAARIGGDFFIDHGSGVVIGETAEIGESVTLYQGVTLGGTGKETGKRHPTVQAGVIVGTGARVLGPVVIGEGAKIGAGSIVIKDVPPNSTVVGNPGRPVIVDGQRVPRDVHHPDIEHTRLPDPVAEALACLVRRVGELEREVKDLREGREHEPRLDDDEDCLPTVQEEISTILGLNPGAGI
jgi:serine O-acetyltransferase